MDIGPLRIETGFFGDAAGNMWWDWSWSPARRARNKALDEAARRLDREARDITRAGDQFDKGGDIYSKAGFMLHAAEVIRSMQT